MSYVADAIAAFIQLHGKPPTEVVLTPVAALALAASKEPLSAGVPVVTREAYTLSLVSKGAGTRLVILESDGQLLVGELV